MEQTAEISGLATFAAVVREGSLAGAARFLGVPKSTVSRRLARLEEALSYPLVLREGRRVQVTEAGHRLYDRIAGALSTIESALEELDSAHEAISGTVRLSAPADFGRLLLVQALADFSKEFPDIDLDLNLSDRMVDLVQEGYDLVIRAGEHRSDPDLILRKLMPSVLRLGAAPAIAKKIKTVDDLKRQGFVRFRARQRVQRLRLQSLERQAGPQNQIEIEAKGPIVVHDYTAMVAFVAAGTGVGLMPDIHLADAKSRGLVVPVLPALGVQNGFISLAYPSRQMPKRVRLLFEFLSERFRN